ncbi:MAG: Hsp70 family protein [Acidimicrobiales bacterium]
MSYQVGIDLGTTYTAAAVHRDEKASIFSLGGRAAAIPSVVLLREDETILTGEATVRRAITGPSGSLVSSSVGSATPPRSSSGAVRTPAEALMARLLRAVLDEVTTRDGASVSRIAVSHPANWGPCEQLDLFRQALRLAGLDQDSVVTLTEPEAAAISTPTRNGSRKGRSSVYDLGGGTFDACVLQRTHGGSTSSASPRASSAWAASTSAASSPTSPAPSTSH